MMSDKQFFMENCLSWSTHVFYDGRSRVVFKAIKDAWEKHQETDMSVITGYLKEEELNFVVECAEASQGMSDAYLVKTLESAHRVRELTAACIQTIGSATNDGAFERLSEKILNFKMAGTAYPEYTMKQLLENAVEKWSKKEPARRIYRLGIPLVDDLVRLRDGNICFIVAPPKSGKTWMEAVIAESLSMRYKVYMVSAEMDPHDVFVRMASKICEKDLSVLDYTPESAPIGTFKALSDNAQKIVDHKFECQKAAGINIEQAESVAHTAIARGFDIILYDYLQRIENHSAEDYRVSIVTMSRKLTNLAKKYNKLLIVAVQGNDPQENKLCTSNNVKESKAPREDGDVLLTITNTTNFTVDWRTNQPRDPSFRSKDDPYELAVEIFQRNGRCGFVGLQFDPTTGRYSAQ